LTWTFYLLDEHPDVKADLLSEIEEVLQGRPATVADVPRLEWTDRVLKESMRLYPPAWALFCRQAVRDVQIGEYTLPAGSLLFIYPWVVQRDPRFFPDPQRFDPDRFSKERLAQLPSGAYIPFGLGPHSCIGEHMARIVLTLVLTRILQGWDLRRADGQGPPELEPLLSLRPRGDLRMRVLQRLPTKRKLVPSAG
jgi:cytochrome P450